MKITFTPQLRFDSITDLSLRGDVLTINGEDFDFTPLPDGYSVPVKSSWIVGAVKRQAGELQVVIACPSIIEDVIEIVKAGIVGVPKNEQH